jgi:hypothetical protein
MKQESNNLPLFPESEKKQTADDTLCLVASLDAPPGLADRVHRRIASAEREPAKRPFWSLWQPVRRMQFAGAALIAIAVAGSTWGVYHSAHDANGSVIAPVTGPTTNFGTGAAERRPTSIAPIRVPSKVPPASKKKPSAARAKAAPKTQATPTAISAN